MLAFRVNLKDEKILNKYWNTYIFWRILFPFLLFFLKILFFICEESLHFSGLTVRFITNEQNMLFYAYILVENRVLKDQSLIGLDFCDTSSQFPSYLFFLFLLQIFHLIWFLFSIFFWDFPKTWFSEK